MIVTSTIVSPPPTPETSLHAIMVHMLWDPDSRRKAGPDAAGYQKQRIQPDKNRVEIIAAFNIGMG